MTSEFSEFSDNRCCQKFSSLHTIDIMPDSGLVNGPKHVSSEKVRRLTRAEWNRLIGLHGQELPGAPSGPPCPVKGG